VNSNHILNLKLITLFNSRLWSCRGSGGDLHLKAAAPPARCR